MSKQITIHTLSYRANHNINRDNFGRPKNCFVGGTERGRYSSQAAKSNIVEVFRNSDEFRTGHQTALIGRIAYNKMIEGGVDEKKAEEYAFNIMWAFVKKKDKAKDEDGKGNKKDPFKSEVIKIQDTELAAVDSLIKKIIEGYEPDSSDYNFLRINECVDIALFGRMLAANPAFEVEAAVSVSHAFTANECTAEEDHFTAVDSLQDQAKTAEGKEHKGSAFLDKTFFAEGVFYHAFIINIDLLKKNLGGSSANVADVIRKFLELVAKVSPKACSKKAAGSQSPAAYMMVEKSDDDFPCQYALAFQDPIEKPHIMERAIEALEDMKEKYGAVYGQRLSKSFNIMEGKGSLQEVIDFAIEDIQSEG